MATINTDLSKYMSDDLKNNLNQRAETQRNEINLQKRTPSLDTTPDTNLPANQDTTPVNSNTIEKYGFNTNKSLIRYNREYLISQTTAKELNTYISFDPFVVFNDLYKREYDTEGNEITKEGPNAPGVRSLFNKFGAVMISGNVDKKYYKDDVIIDKAGDWRIANNVPLIDNVETRKAIRKHSGCSVKELVQASQEGRLGRETYDYSDFMYCKYLGKISNNYLITLRRFPIPVDDFISSYDLDGNDEHLTSKNSQSLGCMVTWMGVSGNEMSNLLSYSYSMPFKTAQSGFQEDRTNPDSQASILQSMASMMDKEYRKQYQLGNAGAAVEGFMGLFPGLSGAKNPYDMATVNAHYDSNKVYGPVDVIKETYMRSEEGLKYAQSFTITFDYELRAYNGINARQAMLDLISNILNVTYTTGSFWGGAYRGTGAHQNNIYTNMSVFKENGGFSGFMDAIYKDFGTIVDQFKQSAKDNGGAGNMIKNFANDLGGMILGALLNKLGRPQLVQNTSLLSPAPVGLWHVTIGNPHHPIMSIGNMILKSTKIEHYGPLGLDDFPTGLKVTCELERGKGRDSRDIEKLYMHGNDRIYSSMGSKVFDMYKNADEYKNNYKSNVDFQGDASSEQLIDGATISAADIKELRNTMQKYFGHVDVKSIDIAACEIEYGSEKNKKNKGGSK